MIEGFLYYSIKILGIKHPKESFIVKYIKHPCMSKSN